MNNELKQFIELLKKELDFEYEEQTKMLELCIEQLDKFSVDLDYTNCIVKRQSLNMIYFIKNYLLENAIRKFEEKEGK